MISNVCFPWIIITFKGLSFYFCLQVVAKKYRGFEIPAEMTGVWRYLSCAYQREEFTNTCPAEKEILFAYLDVAKRIR